MKIFYNKFIKRSLQKNKKIYNRQSRKDVQNGKNSM